VSAVTRIVLVGLPGAGKSALAKGLAERIGGVALDTDAEVESSAGKDVSSLFADEGEAAFRDRELAALAAALESAETVVIATGGGIVTTEAARALLRAHHPVVFLDVSVDAAVARVGDARSRPLLGADPAGRLAVLASERRPLYEEVADVVVSADGRSVPRVLDALEEALGIRA
jgi:shikimate kinase